LESQIRAEEGFCSEKGAYQYVLLIFYIRSVAKAVAQENKSATNGWRHSNLISRLSLGRGTKTFWEKRIKIGDAKKFGGWFKTVYSLDQAPEDAQIRQKILQKSGG